MGSHKKERQLVALIAEKDIEIQKLQSSLEAHNAHAVATNSRLSLALDTLDSAQNDYACELAAEAEAKERLRKKLARCLTIIEAAEVKQAEMHDVISDLVDKVERSHSDFKSWSHSRIKVPHLLEPLEKMPHELSDITSEHDLWTYVSGMIKFLRSSLAAERRAHAETQAAARARITLLEAQVARRDLELEECFLHLGQAFPRASTGARNPLPNIPVFPSSPPPVTTADTPDNGQLEEEVVRLTALLEQARKNRVVPPSDTRETGATSTILSEAVHQTPARTSNSGRRKRDRPDSQARYGDHRRRRSSGSRRRSVSFERRRPSSSSPNNIQELDPDRTIRPDPPHVVRSPTTEEMHASLNREIDVLGVKIDEFHLEKQRLLAQVHAGSHGVQEVDDPQSRLSAHQQPEDQPPSQQHQTRNGVQTPAGSPVPSPRPGAQDMDAQLSASLTQGRLLEDYDGEMSMDLATPLVPNVLLPVAGGSTFPPPPPPAGSNFVFAPPLPVSTEISPLDLSSDHPLPGGLSPRDDADPKSWQGVDVGLQLQPGEQAIQELMDIATTAKTKAS
ncbi:hypothetical protein B0H19DRAFT_1383207 [Mycena capillaripes]|nr:hypothetical protein B0H19DRAFT_1383207 [Mycena capillaripes]